MLKRKMEFNIELSEETVDKLISLTSVVNFLDKHTEELTPEDVIKAALVYYLERFYNTSVDEYQSYENHLFELEKSDYPLKTRIKELIAKRSITPSQLAEKIGISKGTISNIVNDKHLPTLDVFIRIYVALGCPPLKDILYRDIPE